MRIDKLIGNEIQSEIPSINTLPLTRLLSKSNYILINDVPKEENFPFSFPVLITEEKGPVDDLVASDDPLPISMKIESPETSKRGLKFRFILCEAPPEIQEKSGVQDFSKGSKFPTSSSSSLTEINSVSPEIKPPLSYNYKVKNHKIPQYERTQKCPYPAKFPTKSFEGLTFKLNNEPKTVATNFQYSQSMEPENSKINSMSSQILSSDKVLTETKTFTEIVYEKISNKSEYKPRKITNRRQHRRKGNSFARVMADRGLIESTLMTIPMINLPTADLKSGRFPFPPTIEFPQMVRELEDLKLETTGLKIKPDITWKSAPLSIQHLPHYEALHETEAYVASILRLTPIQYINAKHSLITAKRRYDARLLPFRKSDAQKFLRTDVNKASKLWEFFTQLQWI
ncbi:hypothetical protein G9A89_001002 [Geosiphon pyriformis]|nr:hypothetical protein G9A89_001002 [Geosiphon pyriformis]